MNKVILIVIEWLIQGIKILLYICKGLTFGLSRIFSYLLIYLEKGLERIRSEKYRFSKPETKSSKSIPVAINPVIVDRLDIVGRTKTEFITELPKLKATEPHMSEPLEKELVSDYDEEPDIDSDDVVTEEKSLRDIIAEQQPDLFSHEEDMPSEDVSSGVTIEQLAETYDTLTDNNATNKQDEEAGNILENLDGNAIFYFFILQSECSMKAKQLLERKKLKKISENQENNFDMDKYI